MKQRPRRLSPKKLAVLRKELSQLEQLGIIRPSSSPWESPVHMVKKSNGSWRVVGDYRRLKKNSTAELKFNSCQKNSTAELK